MGKVKKAFLFIIGLALATTAVCYGLLMYTEAQPSGDTFDSKIDEDSVYKVYTKTTYIGDAYEDNDLFRADSKYIWFKGETKMMAVSGATLQSKIIESAEEQGVDIYKNLGSFIKDVENVVYNFTAGYNLSFYKFRSALWKYGSSDISAFGDVFSDGEVLDDEYHNSNPLARKGLDLKMKNIKVEKVISGDELVAYGVIAAQVSADVTCKKRSADFDSLDWLPKEGETRHVTFMYSFWTSSQSGGRLAPLQILVLDTEDI